MAIVLAKVRIAKPKNGKRTATKAGIGAICLAGENIREATQVSRNKRALPLWKNEKASLGNRDRIWGGRSSGNRSYRR